MFHRIAAGLLVALAGTALAAPTPQASAPPTAEACCTQLSSTYPLQTFEVGTTNYTTYNDFWSNSAVLSPSCVFAPAFPEEVAAAVKVFVSKQCHFAAKGGGHMAVPGAANVNNGVLISFDNMKNATIKNAADGTEIVAVQPGLHWGDLYTYTDQFNKIPVCGRFYPVGTGLALGAGFSFLSNEVGFATDNVYSFEMVLADGRMVTASQTQNSDLYKAQKGGGNNFGIVTRYNLRLYEGGKVVGGMVISAENTTNQWLDLTYDYNTRQAVKDFKTHALPAVAWVQENNQVLTETPLFYNKHDSSTLPPIMSGWNNLPAISNTVRQALPHELATEFATGFANGDFQEQRVFTIKANRAEYAYIWSQFLQWARSQKNIPGFNILHCNMPVTPNMMSAGKKFGGNSLGLDNENQVLTVMYLGITMHQRDDAVVNSFRTLFDNLQTHSKQANLFHPWIFWNYAGIGQDPISSYGTASNNFMRTVRTKYDPNGVFKTLVAGGFKLS